MHLHLKKLFFYSHLNYYLHKSGEDSYNSGKEWTGIPIMSANMDTVGTPAMHDVLSKYNLIT